MFFVVVFKILDSKVKDIVRNLVIKIRNQLGKELVNGKAHVLKGTEGKEGLPEKISPGKINVKLMTY